MQTHPTISNLDPQTRLPKQVRERVARLADPAPRAQQSLVADPPPAPEAAPAPKPADRESDPGYWKQRFQVTEGMLKKLKDETEGRLAAAEERAREAADALAKSIPEAPVDLKLYFTEKQIEEYGEDYLRTTMTSNRKLIQDVVQNALKPMQDKLETQAKAPAAKARDAFLAAITDALPNWKEIDTDPMWLAWLAGKGRDRVQRQVKLDALSRENDAEGVIALFKKFLAEQGAEPRPAAPQELPHAGNAGGEAEVRVPGRMQQGDEPVTRQYVKDFYKRKALGKISADEAKRVEARIDAAYAAGQVR